MEINAVQFRANCFKILDEVKQSHKEVIITKRGKPIAKLVHIKQNEADDPLLGAMEGVGRTLDDLTEPVMKPIDWELD
jgi:prevent-host-death family protein